MLRSLLLMFCAKVCLCCNSQDAWYSPFVSGTLDLFLTSITHSETAAYMEEELYTNPMCQWDSNTSFIVVPKGDPLYINCSTASLLGTHCSIHIAKGMFHLLKKISSLVSFFSIMSFLCIIFQCIKTSSACPGLMTRPCRPSIYDRQ